MQARMNRAEAITAAERIKLLMDLEPWIPDQDCLELPLGSVKIVDADFQWGNKEASTKEDSQPNKKENES